jgi:pimeloyl-ACP methyl ester carboxylesterase
MARFVLVHGAFAGGWCWERLVPELEAAGHSVETFDLPGHGDDATPPGDVTLDAYVERVGRQLESSQEPTVLVGHSMGGVVITQAAARFPDRIALLAYVCAFLPGDGQSLIELTQQPEGEGDQIQANLVVEGEPPVATLPQDVVARIVHGECDAETAAWATAKRSPQAVAPFVTPVDLGDGIDDIPRAYVKCTRDLCIPPPLQDRMVRDHPCVAVESLDADHSPFLSRTAELATILDRYARLVPA